MLTNLKIQNFALIESLNLNFSNGLTVITGETGSGKSILLGALRLLLGERADFSLIRDANQKTIVEGIWDVSNHDIEAFFEQNDLDYEQLCLIRREISPTGKSRAFVNDTPVNLMVLKELTEQLIQINSQHHTLALKDKLFQLSILDYLGGNISLLEQYKKTYKSYLEVDKLLKDKQEYCAEMIKNKDYQQFQLEELDLLGLDKNNFEVIKNDLEKAEHSEEIVSTLGQIINFLEAEDGGVSQFKKARAVLSKITSLSSVFELWEERIQSQIIELEDFLNEVSSFAENIDEKPQNIEDLTQKLDNFYRICKKHNVNSQEELIRLQTALENESQSTEALEEEIAQMSVRKNKLWEELQELAQNLSNQRQIAANNIVTQMQPLLSELKLPDTQIEFRLSEKEHPTANGKDNIELLFSPNKGMVAKTIEKTASGGELSRFMLVIQTLLSEKKQLPSVVFDEIDTGVSGDVADRLGKLMRKMASKRQVFAITHLPQVAAAGKNHLKVTKSTYESDTITNVSYLDDNEKINEVAQLMSGQKINAAAIENAKILINQQL